VNSGSSGTTCTDGFAGGGPELQWRVQIAGQGYTTYPVAGVCYVNPPNTQYTEVFNCALPANLQVCLQAFEDDGAACVVSMSCLEQTCQNFATPTPGNSVTYNLSIPNDGSNTSWGDVNFTITATGSFPPGAVYDQICNAINLGTVNSGGILGDKTLSNYANFCAGNTGDPNPWGGTNDQGVWFSFTTGATIGSSTLIEAVSDPQSLGDQVNLQLALYESSNNLCSGALTLVQEDYDGAGVIFNESMSLSCLKPNTTYFLLVDGEGVLPTPSEGVEGYFGIEITDNGIAQAADLICDAQDLGVVPAGGSVTTGGLNQSNNCATNTSDPTPSGWTPDQTVWFQFQAPATGSVVVNAVSDLAFPIGTDEVDLELAVYSSNDNTCTGTLAELESGYTAGLFDETLIVRCLTPGENYWVLVDGSAVNVDGIFDLTITDEGVNYNSAGIDTQTACDSYTWTDGVIYTTDNATALDTFVNALGCDSIVTLNLTIVNSDTVYAGSDSSICIGLTSGSLLGSIPVSGSGAWTSLGGATVDFPTQNNSSVSGLLPGSNEFVWTITNSPCPTIKDTVNIVIEDTVSPLVFCPANQDVYFNSNCEFVLADYTSLASGSDNCSSVITFSQNPSPGTVLTATQLVVLIADDGNGNKDSCQFSVIPSDTTSPVIICPGNQNVYYDLNCEYALPDYKSLATVSDNCALFTGVTQIPAAGTLLTANQIVTLMANDGNGNMGSCQFDVIVSDTTSPLITCPGNQTVYYDSTCSYLMEDYIISATTSDNCSSAITVTQFPLPGSSFSLAQTVTLTADDGNGNVSTCTFEVTPMDTIAPTLTCVLDTASCYPIINYMVPIATENCGVATVTQSAGLPSGSVFPVGVTTNTFEAQDTSGNISTCSFDVTIYEKPVASATSIDVNCNGGADGSIDLTVSNGLAPYSFSWSNGVITEDNNAIQAGTHTVVVEDDNTCKDTLDMTINEPPLLVVSKTIINNGCYGISEGSIDITVSGGVSPYRYNWSTGDTTTIVVGLLAGSYTVIVTDSHNCVISDTYTVQQPNEFELDVVLSEFFKYNVSEHGACDGTIDLTVFGGFEPYNYTWSSGDSTKNITDLCAGTYTVEVVDLDQCTASGSFTLVEPEPVVVPEGFSPNYDGINDFFIINGLDVYPNNSIEIFNRWGNITYKAAPYENDWDGTSNYAAVGKKAPDGSYFYKLKLKDDKKPIMGYIIIKR